MGDPHPRVGRHLNEVISLESVIRLYRPLCLPQNMLSEAGVFRYPTPPHTPTYSYSSVNLEQLMLKGHATNLHFFTLKKEMFTCHEEYYSANEKQYMDCNCFYTKPLYSVSLIPSYTYTLTHGGKMPCEVLIWPLGAIGVQCLAQKQSDMWPKGVVICRVYRSIWNTSTSTLLEYSHFKPLDTFTLYYIFVWQI